MLHGFCSPGIFVIRFLYSSTSFPLWTMSIPLLLTELQSAVCSQTESSWPVARTSSRKGGLRAIQLALTSGVNPEATCKAILPLGLLWGLLQTCHSTHTPFCGFWQGKKKAHKQIWLILACLKLSVKFSALALRAGFCHSISFQCLYITFKDESLQWKRGCESLTTTYSCVSISFLQKWFVSLLKKSKNHKLSTSVGSPVKARAQCYMTFQAFTSIGIRLMQKVWFWGCLGFFFFNVQAQKLKLIFDLQSARS